MKPVTVRGITIGEGLPKICMPLVARDFEELKGAIREAVRLQPDLLEWRADHYEGLTAGEIPDLFVRLHKQAGELPILFTFRSSGEG